MTTLNFHPYYEQLIKRKEKYTTVRLGDRRSEYRVGDVITITVGWDEKSKNDVVEICRVQITGVQYKTIKNITESDLVGESPECASKESVPYVLSAIYRRVVAYDDSVTIIRWRYLS